MRTTQLIAIAAAVGALGFAGCGDDPAEEPSEAATPASRTVDTATIEKQIKQQLSTADATVTKAKCPDDVEVKTDGTFKCSVTWDNGATGKVKVTQEGAGRYTYKPVSGSVQVPGSVAEKQVEAELAKQGAPNAQANCPDNIIVKVDTTVTCDLSTAGGASAGSVTFGWSSEEGTVDSSSVETTG